MKPSLESLAGWLGAISFMVLFAYIRHPDSLVLRLSLTAVILVVWVLLIFVLGLGFEVGLNEDMDEEQKKAHRRLETKGYMWMLLVTALALLAVALVWRWIAL